MSVLSRDQWAQLLGSFLQEAVDLLEQAESALLQLDQGVDDHELIHGLFRNVHTLKGSAGLFALEGVVAFAHRMESRIMRARDGGEALQPEEITALLEAVDILRGEVSHLEAGGSSRELESEHAPLLARIEAGAANPLAPIAGIASEVEPAAAAEGRWHVSIRFDRDLFASGLDPASLVRYLGTLGEIVHVVTLTDGLPAWTDFDPEQCYLGLELSLDSEASKAEIEDVFSFLADTASVRILPPRSRLEDYFKLIEQLPEDTYRLGEILIAAGLLTRRELEIGLGRQSAAAVAEGQTPRLGEVLVNEGMVAPAAVEAALRKQSGPSAPRKSSDGFLRVSARKMDELINLVGELVTATAGAEARARRSTDPEFLTSASEINHHVEQIREVALGLRMVEIGETFNRFQRMVRDVSTELGKAIELRIEGAETELDKTLVERIGEPLTHLVRNAIDHGIEPLDARRAAGKPEQGRVTLAARHEAGSVVIEISDDGRGLDPQKIRAKAIARGLISAEAELPDAALRELIFAPGFSTADQISNLSGRGVGMDVVKRTVESLRGSIDIESEVGAGCCFRIRLPLTLAIIDGFLVEVAGTTLVLPLDMVTECFEAPGSARDRQESICDLRGRPLPLLCLRRHYRFDGQAARRQNVVVVDTGRERIGLLVDSLQGQQQVVIKPMGALFRQLDDIAGATILGSGSVALILDISRLAQAAGRPALSHAA
jgi:two-component system chemotaxis sensor kinase CheA